MSAVPRLSGNPAGGTHAPLPLPGSLVEAEVAESVGWLIRLRWFAGLGVLVITLAIPPIFAVRVSTAPLLAIGLGILTYNLVFFLLERRYKTAAAAQPAYLRLTLWQVTLDWLAMSLLIHYSGGIESPAIFFFLFHIVIASIFSPRRIAFAFTLLAVILLTSIALLEYAGWLPHEPVTGLLKEPLYTNPLYVAGWLLFFNSTALIVAYLATTISERLRRREEEVVRLTHDLQRASARLQALNDSARSISSTLDLSQVLNRLVKDTAEVMGVRACSIRLLDKSGKRLEPAATWGLSREYLEKGPIELESNPLAREVMAGKIVNVPDAKRSPLLQYPAWAEKEGIASMLSAPLVGKNCTLGILRAYSEERNHFTPDDENFLAAIAAQGSIAIENALAYQAMENLDATKSAFVRMVTHELRSPVSVTRSLLRTITAGYAGELTPQQRDILERAGRRIEVLQKLVDDLLDLAAGKVELSDTKAVEVIDLRQAVARVVNRYTVPAEEKSLTLELRDETQGAPLPVHATAEGLDRAFNNLVSNAVKYTPPGGQVTVTLRQEGGQAVCEVADTGIGIPEDALARLFEEFYRAPNARELEREGTGLGLTIVKDTITRFGGQVSVESELGKGSRFTVTLPLAGEGESASPLRAASASPLPGGEGD